MSNYKAFYAEINAKIRKFGFTVMGISGHGETSFSYTIGLSTSFGFEILVVGLPVAYAHQIFYSVYNMLLDGMTIDLGKPIEGLGNFPLMFEECNHANPLLFDKYAVQAEQILGYKPRILQMVIPDQKGKFPDDADFNHEYMDKFQPRLSAALPEITTILSKIM